MGLISLWNCWNFLCNGRKKLSLGWDDQYLGLRLMCKSTLAVVTIVLALGVCASSQKAKWQFFCCMWTWVSQIEMSDGTSSNGASVSLQSICSGMSRSLIKFNQKQNYSEQSQLIRQNICEKCWFSILQATVTNLLNTLGSSSRQSKQICHAGTAGEEQLISAIRLGALPCIWARAVDSRSFCGEGMVWKVRNKVRAWLFFYLLHNM